MTNTLSANLTPLHVNIFVSTTTKAGSTITKATLKEADKLYLQTGIKSDSFLRNKVVPRVKDVYYSGKNFIYDPENILKGMSIADIIYGAVSPKPPATLPQSIGNRINEWLYKPIKYKIKEYTNE